MELAGWLVNSYEMHPYEIISRSFICLFYHVIVPETAYQVDVQLVWKYETMKQNGGVQKNIYKNNVSI